MQHWLTFPLGAEQAKGRVSHRLDRAQRALIDWAKVDDHDAILDIDCQEGGLLSHYMGHYRLRACGIASTNHDIEIARQSLDQGAELLLASPSDLPWRARSFHAVFISRPLRKGSQTVRILSEALRVLKPGMQLLIAMEGHHLLARLGIRQQIGADTMFFENPFELMEVLTQQGFEDVSMRMSRLGVATIIAHSPNLSGN